MCSAVSVFRAAPSRWLSKKQPASPSFLQLSRGTSSLPQGFFSASQLVASCRRLQSGELREASRTPRYQGYFFHHLPSTAVLARAAGGAQRSPPAIARTTASAGPPSTPLVCYIVLSSPALSLTFPSLSGIPSSRRFFASKTPTSSAPPPSPQPSGAPSQHLPVQAGEQQVSHEVERRHGDELKNFYHMPCEHHGDPRHHINPDGTLRFQTTAESFHWENDAAATPAQQIVSVNGRKMIKGIETRDFVELFQIHQKNIPFWPRMRMSTWGNHDLLMKAEFLFFWVPTFIIWSLAVPMFTMLYMSDEAIYASMTVKVIGRQWYWIYEVESPVDEEE